MQYESERVAFLFVFRLVTYLVRDMRPAHGFVFLQSCVSAAFKLACKISDLVSFSRGVVTCGFKAKRYNR